MVKPRYMDMAHLTPPKNCPEAPNIVQSGKSKTILIQICRYKTACLYGSCKGCQVGNVPYIGRKSVSLARSSNRESSVSKFCPGLIRSSLLNEADDVLALCPLDTKDWFRCERRA